MLVVPLYDMFFCYFLLHFIHFMTKKNVKNCFCVKKLISTSKWHAEHPFAGRNTQHFIHKNTATNLFYKFIANHNQVIAFLKPKNRFQSGSNFDKFADCIWFINYSFFLVRMIYLTQTSAHDIHFKFELVVTDS